MRESMVIYRSFFEAISNLPKDDQADVWNAIFEFSFNFKEVELTGIGATVFILIKPQLQANITKYKTGVDFGHLGAKHGKKGGRPQKNPQTETKKPSPNPHQTLTEPSNANVNANVNVNDNVVFVFDLFRKKYPGTKRGISTEFTEFKRHKDWVAELPKLMGALDHQIQWREHAKKNKVFVPEWKNLKTWLHQRCWEDEDKTVSVVRPNTMPINQISGVEERDALFSMSKEDFAKWKEERGQKMIS